MLDFTRVYLCLRPICPFSKNSQVALCILRGTPPVLVPHQDPTRGYPAVSGHTF